MPGKQKSTCTRRGSSILANIGISPFKVIELEFNQGNEPSSEGRRYWDTSQYIEEGAVWILASPLSKRLSV